MAVPREARPYQGESAGLVTRFVASMIDAAVVGIALGACYLGFASFLFLLDPREFTFPTAGVLLSLTAALTLSIAYLALAWWLAGRTYGGHVMGIRVTGRGGRRLGPLRSLARAAFCVFFPIGLFWCVVSPHRRSVQDAVLWTRVVYDWLPHPAHDDEDGAEGDGGGNGHGRGIGDGGDRPSAPDTTRPGDAGAGDPGGLGPPAAGDVPPRSLGGDSGRAPHPDRPRP